MNNFKMFCICINNNLINKVIKLNYTPVGLGSEKFSKEWLTDKSADSISEKNKYYGEYTFHYWFWKNMLNQIPDNQWIGFCAYRRFWSNNKIKVKSNNIYDSSLSRVPKEWNDYDAIIGDHQNLEQVKWVKVIKYGKRAFLRNPLVFLKNKRNIRFQFDMFHGNGVLDKAINQLDDKDRNDFRDYVLSNTSFNQGNMFICRSKKIINEYYITIFKWLSNCEKIFGFNLEGYGKIRVYAFLAERFLGYWFKKNARTLEWPIVFNDLNSEKD
jgi:hypothetical protein